MKQGKKANNQQSNKLNKRSPDKKYFSLSKYIARNREDILRIVAVAVLLIIAIGAIPSSYTFTKSISIPFDIEEKESADLELGDSEVIQEGREGKKTITIESTQNLWGRLFGAQPVNQKEVSSTITEKPVNKMVANGTRKYQYMLCSDGSYRYYTDEEFKDKNTGFTSRSSDYCKENGQGEMTQLADTPSGQVVGNSERKPTVTVQNGCTYTSIPYKTVYRDVSWLNKGETRVSKGRDGTISSCGWSTDPINEEVLRGTSEPSSGFNPPPSGGNQNAAAYQQCVSSYNSAMSQGMSGQEALKRQVESEFARCKRAAGY